MGKYRLHIQDGQTYLNDSPLLVKGLRFSNSLITEEKTDELIRYLDVYAGYGLNTISVFFMGSRYGNIKGYLEDAAMNPVYASRMGKIIEAADERGMVVVVGCLYWDHSTAKWDSWTQQEANQAVRNTVQWLSDNDYRNVIVDVDNEGMARRIAGFDNRELVIAGKSADASIVIGTNYKGIPPEEADLGLHFAERAAGKPYIETEGTPFNAPGSYWAFFSKRQDPVNPYNTINGDHYINVGLHTEDMKISQIADTRRAFDKGEGYMLASTWLQEVPPVGPNHDPGGDGSAENPGVRWWLEFIRDTYRPYVPS